MSNYDVALFFDKIEKGREKQTNKQTNKKKKNK